MKIPNLSGLTGIYRAGQLFVSVHRPEILLGASITATLGAVVMAAKGGYEARGIVDNERAKRAASPEPPFDTYYEYKQEFEAKFPELTAKEKANLTWHCYLPAATLTVGSIGSTVGLHVVHVKEKKALAVAALSAIEEVKREAKEFEKNNVGVLTEEEKSKILEGRADEDPFETAVVTGSDGEIEELYLVRDNISGRDIWSNAQRIEDAINSVNAVISRDGDCELNQFFEYAGYGHLPLGDNIGWSGDFVEARWDTTIRDDGRPVRRFRFDPEPTERALQA